MLQPLPSGNKAAHTHQFKRAFRIRLAYGLNCSKAKSTSSAATPSASVARPAWIFITSGAPKGHSGLLASLIIFYTQCLDRPAFRTHFHQELSFAAFDRAMEDTLVALNTGYWRLRDGTFIARAKGKASIVSRPWRDKLDRIASAIEDIRSRFHDSVGFNRMPYQMHGWRQSDFEAEFGPSFRGNRDLGGWMDEKRNQAIELMNSILSEIGHPPLAGIKGW